MAATLYNVSSLAAVTSAETITCQYPLLLSAKGIWTGDSPLDFTLTLFIVQISIAVLITRLIEALLKPLHQPRVIAEIIGGIILGPSVLGQFNKFSERVFPLKSKITLDTVANLGLVYFLFLIGVETDVLVIKRMGRKTMIIALVGMAVPFAIGITLAFLFRHQISKNAEEGPYLLFIAVSISVTSFPVLARILAEIKLLNTELGRIAMSSAIMNDMCAWVLLAVSASVAGGHKTVVSSLWVNLSGALFVLVCFYVIRPGMWWLIRRIPEGEGVSDSHVCLVLTCVMAAGVTTDVIGIHAVFGAFVIGMVIPNGPLADALVDKLEDFVNGLMLPLFFVNSGLRTDLSELRDPAAIFLLILVFALACAGKTIGTVLISLYYNMPFREALSLAFLSNTRGLIEMIVLNIGRDQGVIDHQTFAVMVVLSLIMTAIITPAVHAVHRPARILLSYKRRNLQRAKPDTELRMLMCVHTPRHVPTMISLLEISNPTKRAPIFVYALHLMELSGRGSVVLKPVGAAGGEQSDDTLVAFEQFEQRAGGVSVQPLTAVSPYSTMHEDVCGLAADKHVSFIVIPFHKQRTVDGGMEATNPGVRTVNDHVLTHAPCSVAILVDRGLDAVAPQRITGPIHHHFTHHVAVLFFGGPDDREALAYAWRLADHPSIGLAVVRFLPSASSPTPGLAPAPDPRVISVLTSEDQERERDDEYFSEFRLKTLSNESVIYMEKVVNSSEDTVSVIRNMDNIYNMYIVGRGQGEGAVGQLTAGLTEWSECPELGPIGDLLTSSDFAATVSVLVVQQYAGRVAESPPKRGGQREKPYAFNVG